MIEVTVRNYLDGELTVPVYLEEPKDKPDEYVVLKVIDNGRINQIDAVTFNIISYATSLYNASRLNHDVKDAMFDIVTIDNISSSRCGGGGQAINTVTKQYAYECVFNIYYMEE